MSLFKGIRKVFKKIGGAIKKQFKRVMKVVGKAGVLGQIAMMFVLPGIGGALMKGISGAFSKIVGSAATKVGAKVAGDAALNAASSKVLETAVAEGGKKVAVKAVEETVKSAAVDTATQTLTSKAAETAVSKAGSGMLGSKNALVRGVGTVLEAAGNFVKVGAKAFSTVTEGVSSFIGEFGKTALNKIPGVNIGSAAPDFATAWSNVQGNVMTNASETLKAFNTSIGYTPPTTDGLANYKPTARVSVDSLKSANIKSAIEKGADKSVNLIEPDGGTLTLPAGSDLSQAADIKARALGRMPDGSQLPTVNSEGMLTDPPVGAGLYELPPIQKPVSLLAPNAETTISANQGLNERLKAVELGGYNGPADPTSNVAGSSTPIQAQSLLDPKEYGNTTLNYLKDVKNTTLDKLMKTYSPANVLENIQEMPKEFLSNFKSTITDAPRMALSASLNKPEAAQVTYNSSSVGAMPGYNPAATQMDSQVPAEFVQYYSNKSRTGQGSYGFGAESGFSQYRKRMGLT